MARETITNEKGLLFFFANGFRFFFQRAGSRAFTVHIRSVAQSHPKAHSSLCPSPDAEAGR